jgi:FkbM family methyltransferase
MRVNNFTVIESIHGRFIVNRHCAFQAESLIKTGKTHIEPELQNILKLVGTLTPGSVLIDAGANIGLISIPIAQALRKKNCIVHAFEVQRMLFYALCGAVALNDLDNVYVHLKGLGRSKSMLKVPRPDYGLPQDFGLLSLISQKEVSDYENVEIIAVDDLKVPRLDFPKVDVEGMEIDILRGAQQTIRAHLPWCWVENWKVGVQPIKQQFADLPYKFFEADKMNILCAPIARLTANNINVDARAL